MLLTVIGPGPPMSTDTVNTSNLVPPSCIAHSGVEPMLTCTLAVGPGIVAVGVPSNATKSRKTAPSLQFGIAVGVVDADASPSHPPGTCTVLSPMTMSPAGAPPKPVGTSVVADTVTFAAVIGGIAAPAGDAQHSEARRESSRARRAR